MRVLFYTGKGGVGKSTVSAATAWQLSQRHRVLIVSLDPAHNLGDVFGVTLNHRRKAWSRSLHLQEADVSRLTRQYLEHELGTLADTYRYMQALNLDRYFGVLKYSPGLEEYALLSAVEQTLREARGYDYVVFDTPPTGLTLRLLALPRITLTWLERLTTLRRLILQKRYTIGKIRSVDGAAPEGVRLAYSEDEDRVMGRLKTLQGRYEALQALLQGASCGVALVFNPDSLSLRETERLIRGLNELELPVRLLVHNKLTGADADLAAAVEARLRALAPGTPLVRVGLAGTLARRGGERLFALEEDLTAHL